jgi:hypothetical protein
MWDGSSIMTAAGTEGKIRGQFFGGYVLKKEVAKASSGYVPPAKRAEALKKPAKTGLMAGDRPAKAAKEEANAQDKAAKEAVDSKGGKRPRATGVETNAQDKPADGAARGRSAWTALAAPALATRSMRSNTKQPTKRPQLGEKPEEKNAGGSSDALAERFESDEDEEGAALSADEAADRSVLSPAVCSVLSPAVRKAREQRAQGPEQQAADKAMLLAALNQVSELWPFTPLLQIAGGMVSSDGHLSLFGMEITVDLLLEQCVPMWARFKEEEALTAEALKEQLKADIDSFPTAVLLVRPVESGGAGSGCALSLCSA